MFPRAALRLLGPLLLAVAALSALRRAPPPDVPGLPLMVLDGNGKIVGGHGGWDLATTTTVAWDLPSPTAAQLRPTENSNEPVSADNTPPVDAQVPVEPPAAPSGGESALLSVGTAPALVWHRTFGDWNSSAGAVAMTLRWAEGTPDPAIPGVLRADAVHYLRIRAAGVFSAQLRSDTAVVPVYIRPLEAEAERVYLAGSAPLVTWQDDGERTYNRWGGKLAAERPPGSAAEGPSGRLFHPERIRKGKGPAEAPYDPSPDVPRGQGFELPFEDPATDEIREWELAFLVPGEDAGGDAEFELTVRNLEPRSSITEPWICSVAISYQDADLPKWTAVSDFLQDMREYCGADRERRDYLNRGNKWPGRPDNTPYNASYVFRQRLRFEQHASPDRKRAIAELYSFVNGVPPAPNPAGQGYRMTRSSLSFGRWLLSPSPNYTVTSPDVFPTRETCPLLYFKDNRSAVCEDPSRRIYRYLPFEASSRAQWLPIRWLTKRCLWRQQPVVLGDSLASQIYNGISCYLRLYAGTMDLFLGALANAQSFPVKFFHPLYPDRGGRLPTFDEYLFYRNSLPWDRSVRIVLWQIGVWPTSYSDSRLWERGMDLLGSFFARDRDEHNLTTYVATVTPPQTLIADGGWTKAPGYQTRGRAAKWNWLLRRTMRRWGVEVVDTYGVLEPRFDERTDNAHYCHGGGSFWGRIGLGMVLIGRAPAAVFELAAYAMARICPE
ncbi:hypothetical protein DFJ74DRAFT_772533 [Hyaloraphidium curvatum]|nr:hypothetical protein DFJ74DRAFT_772533 [Hyaloraphidium curvatum]